MITKRKYQVLTFAALLLVLLYQYIQSTKPAAMIDKLMVVSFTYLLGFVLILLLRFS